MGDGPWYRGITPYQWLVLVLASLGWIFDVFEGQIFVASMNQAMPALLPADAGPGAAAFYNHVTFAAFLAGGALGGVLFGALADRVGRTRTLAWTILLYSAFTCLSSFSQTWWQLAGFRFLVALGVGGEWAVASAFVAEVFPRHARAWSQSIFHASSVLGTYLAIAAGAWVVNNPDLVLLGLDGWRMGFLLGALPALLVVWVRLGLREPARWVQAHAALPPGRIADLFDAANLRGTLVGVSLAAVGLATFWGTHIYGKDMLRLAYERLLDREALPGAAGWLKSKELLGMFLVTTGGGLGLLAFGPLSERLGRRGAFLFYQVGGLAASFVLFGEVVTGPTALCLFLPVFGFLTLGMHAGYAVYFPELFPTRLRGTGGGFCFNVGRLVAAPVLVLAGTMRDGERFSLAQTALLLSLLFLPGVLVLLAAPETSGEDLKE